MKKTGILNGCELIHSIVCQKYKTDAGEVEVYGFEASKLGDTQAESESVTINCVTSEREFAEEILEKLERHGVTPMALLDVLEYLVAEKFTVG